MIKKGQIVRITYAPSRISWFYPMIGQVSQVLDVYEPTGFIQVRLMQPITEYDWCEERPIDRHYQVAGWLDSRFVTKI